VVDSDSLEINVFSKDVGHIDSGGFSECGLVILLRSEKVEISWYFGGGK
jgi:hypothetical protein